jgi:hypothetical protein
MKQKIKTTFSNLLATFWLVAFIFVVYNGSVLIHDHHEEWFDTAQDTYEDSIEFSKDLTKDMKNKVREGVRYVRSK